MSLEATDLKSLIVVYREFVPHDGAVLWTQAPRK
jgi:hypothetical protein